MRLFDYTILVIYLLVVIGIGIVCRSRKRSTNEFFLASRSMSWFPVGVSVMITVFSAINFVAFPQEIIGHGLYVITAIPAFFLVGIPISLFFIPLFYKMEATSAYEFLEKKYDKKARFLASSLFIFWRLIWMGIILYATAKILAMITGVKLPWLIGLCGVIATAYTAFGGIRAVIWTDVAQFFVLVSGIIAVLFFTIAQCKIGISGFIDIVYSAGLLKPFTPYDPNYLSLSPKIRISLWSCLIGASVAFLTRYGADQIVIQRYFTAKSLKVAQISFWWNIFCAVFSISLLAFFGIAVYAFAVQNRIIVPGGKLVPPLKHIANLIKSFPYGGCGLLTAALLAATMSSIDSGINACSAAYYSDFHNHFYREIKTEEQNWKFSIYLTIILGGISMVLALGCMVFLGKQQTIFVMVNKIIHGLGSPLLAIVLLAIFAKKITPTGIFWGGILGVIFSLLSVLLIKDLALHYYAVINLLATLAFCKILSTKQKNTPSFLKQKV